MTVVKIDRFYLRAGVKGFPVELQREMQEVAGCAHVPTYDDVKFSERKRREAKTLADRQALLSQRTLMLRPTARTEHEVIGVAGIRCLAINLRDLVSVLAACKDRNASIYCVNTGRLYDPAHMTVEDTDRIQGEFETAVRVHQTTEGRKVGPQARSKQAEKDRAPIIKLVKPIWGHSPDDPRYKSGAEIVRWLKEEHGIKSSLSALNNWLGPRWKARKDAPQ